jgi:aminoglycoside phosphotransferase (APT) family kinase protein
VEVDEATVRTLLDAQCPRFAGEPLRLVDEGWDNVTFLLGERHAVRLPRRDAAVALLLNEQRWLPVLAARIPLSVPVPVHLGAPSASFRWPWSVVAWVPGDTAERHRFGAADVALLAETLLALHQPAPEDAPRNLVRGVPLRDRAEVVVGRLDRLARHAGVDVASVDAVWREACSVPASEERRWMHGDLHPRNVVVRDGALAGLIDWGDMNGGDVATDLACTWTLVDGGARRRALLDAYGASAAMAMRALGWAVHMGLMLADSGEPRHVPLGLTTLERVLEDA